MLNILVVANDCEWKSWESKLKEVETWFKFVKLTLVKTSLKDIPFSPYEDGRLGVDPKWYDENITWRGVGYDMILFVLPKKQWKDLRRVRGWRTDADQGPVQLQIGCDESDKATSGGWLQFNKKMGAFFLLAVHEILHGCFLITSQPDTTHYYWDRAELEKARDSLMFPKNYKYPALIRSLNYLQALLTKKMLELPFSERLYQLAVNTVGKDASPADLASDEVGCAESVSTLINHLDDDFPIVTGTYSLHDLLKKTGWVKVSSPLPGDIISSPTGTGNGKIPGHVGICGPNGLIYSNSSVDKVWKQNYNTKTWTDRYVKIGGFGITYLRRLWM